MYVHDAGYCPAWQVVDMDGIVGKINCFIVEPFVPHDVSRRSAWPPPGRPPI
jgi:hypothetical protein